MEDKDAPLLRPPIRAAILVLILGAALVAYAQVRDHDFIVFDDGLYVLENGPVQAGLTLDSIRWAFITRQAHNWHPLTWLSLMLDVELAGLDPGWFHLHNLALHLLATILLYLALTDMTSAPGRSLIVAALFALHPLHVESVAWVAERKDVLAGVFWMLTLWAYARYSAAPSPGRYLTVLLALALGLMAKPMLVTLPFVLLLLDCWPLARIGFGKPATSGRFPPTTWPRAIREKIPLLALSALSSLVTIWAQSGGQASALTPMTQVPLSWRLGNVLISYATYLGRTVWPVDMAIFRPLPQGPPDATAMVVAGTILLGLAVLVWRSRRPEAVVGGLWFLGTLVPVIGLVQLGSQATADRYTYLPHVGLFILVVWGVGILAAGSRTRLLIAITLAVLVLAALAGQTWRQVRTWENTKTVFTHALAVTKNNYLAHTCLGIYLKLEHNYEEALVHLDRAVAIEPGYAVAQRHLGYLLLLMDRPAEALLHLEATARLELTDPKLRQLIEEVRRNLGRPLMRDRRQDPPPTPALTVDLGFGCCRQAWPPGPNVVLFRNESWPARPEGVKACSKASASPWSFPHTTKKN